jgi:ubiquinone/menaquinone biosynthesis C-methylase UbiE
MGVCSRQENGVAEEYNPEVYWSRVAQQIQERGTNYIAGDDNAFYRYKRKKFVKAFLDTIDVDSKVVLEVGCGPGGNLKHLATDHHPQKLLGADISQNMINTATKNLRGLDTVALTKIDGRNLPYADRSVDVSFTVTVLQHNTDESAVRSLVRSLCRVTKSLIVVMEDIGTSSSLGGSGDWMGRQVAVYRSVFAESGFRMTQCRFLNTKVSRTWHDLMLRLYKFSTGHREGDPIGFAMRSLIAAPMPITRLLDEMMSEDTGLAKMVFQRTD